MAHLTFFKDPKGTAQLAHRAKSAASSKHEKAEKLASKIRDHRRCRWPHCEHRLKNLTLHSAHLLVHKGMGGSATRNERDNLISLCAAHHGQFDLGNLVIKPRTNRGADGPCSFYLTPAHFVPRLMGRETAVGVLENNS